MEPYLLDTGIWLRLLDSDDPRHGKIRQAVLSLRSSGNHLFTSVQNVREFWNVSTRPATARSGMGLDVPVVELRIGLIQRWCSVLTDSEHTFQTWRRLVSTYRVKGVAVHDAHLTATMLTNNIRRILTVNDRDFRRYEPEGMIVVTPESLVGSPT